MTLQVATPWVYVAPDWLRQVGRVFVVAPPSGSPVSLSDAKDHLRVTHLSEDAMIQRMVDAATLELEAPRGWLGRSLLSQQLQLTLDQPPPHFVYLPGPPVTAIDKIEYRDQTGAVVLVDAADYRSDLTDTGHPALVWPSVDAKRWPSDVIDEPDAFRVTFTAGYATPTDVPEPIHQWILVRVAELYRDREPTVFNASVNKLPHIDNMLENWRVR